MKPLIDTFTFCAHCKGSLVKKSHYKVCTDCDKHYFFNPRATVTLLAANKDGKIMLTKRAIEPFKDWWDLPGGFVDGNENYEQAAVRELKEETGIIASEKDLTYLGSWHDEYHTQTEIIPITCALFKVVVGDVAVKVADDVSDYMFVDPQDDIFNRIAFDGQRAFVQQYLAKQKA